MKHSLVLCSLTTLSLMVLVNCGEKRVEEKKNRSLQKQEQPMATSRIKLPSGLEYEIITEGVGATPAPGKQVTVHYTGWLDDNGKPGAQFDSSISRGKPFSFPIGAGRVIKGWDEGVMSMKVGEKRRLFIPAHLGYGERGAGGVIPPQANLIFDVELLTIS